VPDNKHITVAAWPTAAWYTEKLGRGVPNPITGSRDECARYDQDLSRLLYEELGEFGLGSANPEPDCGVPLHETYHVIATAYGAPPPAWDERTGSFWLDRNACPWAGLSSLSEVEKIPVPDWRSHPMVQEDMGKLAVARQTLGAERLRTVPIGDMEFVWTHPGTGRSYRLSHFPEFLDMGLVLMGSTPFFTTLAADHELAGALMQKCFEISASYNDFMTAACGRPREGWCSMGGNPACLVSADMYRQYAMEFDALVRAKCGNVPRNLHSCGPSRHLYGVWAEYPERDQIVLMQTRAIPGAMAPLRRSLPHTYIQLTIHQPQVDFERESPGRVKDLVWEFAEALGFRDMSITVLFSWVDERVRANLAALFEAGEDVNAEAASRAVVMKWCCAG